MSHNWFYGRYIAADETWLYHGTQHMAFYSIKRTHTGNKITKM